MGLGSSDRDTDALCTHMRVLIRRCSNVCTPLFYYGYSIEYIMCIFSPIKQCAGCMITLWCISTVAHACAIQTVAVQNFAHLLQTIYDQYEGNSRFVRPAGIKFKKISWRHKVAFVEQLSNEETYFLLSSSEIIKP